VVASWDFTLRVYDVDKNELLCTNSVRAPVLDGAFGRTHDEVYGVSVDQTVREFNVASPVTRVIGTHDGVVSRALYSNTTNQLITGSWDHTLRLWDSRQAQTCIKTRQLPERVYDMDISEDSQKIVVGMAGRQNEIYDLRKMDEPLQRRESSLKYMTRAVACMQNGTGYATGSTEGRIAVEYFDPSPGVQAQKYAFKCHRHNVDGQDKVWPVNALAFNPAFGTFASGGSDGIVSVWDYKLKKRLRQYAKFHAAVTSVAFNSTGTKMAVGVGYLHEEGHGEKGSKSSIIIKSIDDSKSKAK